MFRKENLIMKRTSIVIGILMVLVMGLVVINGCASKKSTVKDGAAQDQQVTAAAAPAASNQSATTTNNSVDSKVTAGEKEQSAKVEAASTLQSSVADIYFDFDKSNIRPDAREILKGNASALLKNGNATVVIEGNCDERGTAEYNMALGERRAREAKKYLVNLGLKDSKIKTISYGKERPVDPGHNEEAWTKNRNDHFVVTEK
jgi:peptidoglycan-associated lipoprotein